MSEEGSDLRADSAARRAAALYFAAQPAAILVWWIVIAAQPNTRGSFFPQEVLTTGLTGWFAADMIGVLTPPAVTSILAYTHRRAARYTAFTSSSVSHMQRRIA